MTTVRKKLASTAMVFSFIKALSLFLFIFLFTSTSFSQDKSVIQGIVYEEGSELPMSGAHVLINGTSYGTITGPDGSFRLIISSFPVSLKVSHVGFEDRFFEVSKDVKEEQLMLGMKFRAELLEGVTITDQKVETIFKNETYSVLDFEFHNNGLILLIYRNRVKRAELVLLSTMNDTLASLTSLPGRATSLHRDCRENIHYVARDSAYQIYFTGKELQLVHPINLSIFIPVANSFYAYFEENYYYGIKKIQNQVIHYIRYDSLSGEYYPFRLIADSKTLEILKDNPNHGYLLDNLQKERDPFKDFELMLMSNESAEAQAQALELSRTQTREAHYLKTCVYSPIYAPLFLNGEELIIFNHPGSMIEHLSGNSKMIRSCEIDYHKKNDWEEMVIRDEISGHFYTLYNDANRISIHQINIESGELGEANILYYPFVKKVLVRNGYAYFTYRQPGSVDNTMLFRQKLKASQEAHARSD